MKSLVTKLLDDGDVTTVNTSTDLVSGEFHLQRVADERGAMQITFNQDPVGSNIDIVLEGRMFTSPTGSQTVPAWGELHTPVDIADFTAAPNFSLIVTDVQLVPHVRVRFYESGGTAAVAASTTVDVDLME